MDTMDKDCPLLNIIRVLQHVQNEFLENALLIAGSGHCQSLNFLARDGGTGVLHRVSLDRAHNEIINFKWKDSVLQNSDIGTEYGKGCNVTYNFLVIERALAQSLLMDKAILTDGTAFSQFAFSDDLFNASSAIIPDISNRIDQEPLSEDAILSIETSIQSQKKFASELLDNLEIMFVLLKKTGGNPASALEEYIQRWSTQLPGSFPGKLLPDTWGVIKLSNVVALYRILEKHMADEYIKSLEQPLRAKIPENVCRDIKLRLSGTEPVEQIESAAGLIRLFVFRYLRPTNKVHRDTLNTRLIDVMERSAGETMDLSTLSDFVTDGVCVRHVHKIHELIEEEVKVFRIWYFLHIPVSVIITTKP